MAGLFCVYGCIKFGNVLLFLIRQTSAMQDRARAAKIEDVPVAEFGSRRPLGQWGLPRLVRPRLVPNVIRRHLRKMGTQTYFVSRRFLKYGLRIH